MNEAEREPGLITSAAIERFTRLVARMPAGPNSDNPVAGRAGADRRHNLAVYLGQLAQRRPRVLLLGEAPGYRGWGVTGIPFTNRNQLATGIDRFGLFGPGRGYRLPADDGRVWAEPTATVMWRTLEELDFLPLLWSAYPLHSHRPDDPHSNRTPSAPEVAAGEPVWRALLNLFQPRAVVAVGNIAARSIRAAGMTAPKVRHPAHGGAALFKQGLADLLAEGLDD